MALLVQFIQALGAVILSALIGLVAYVLTIALLGWILAGLYGREALLNAPGHGGGFAIVGLFFIAPIAGIAALALVAWLSVVFYRMFRGMRKQTA